MPIATAVVARALDFRYVVRPHPLTSYPLISSPMTTPTLRVALALPVLASSLAFAQGRLGYYRQPTIRGNTIVFVAEGDLWKVGAAGGVATRLTTHPGDEASPRLSPDGSRVAFTAEYEGAAEVYVMPTSGGLPKRLTFDSSRCTVAGWTSGPEPRVIAGTNRFSTLPNTQLTLINPGTDAATISREVVPLAQASDGTFDGAGNLFFTRLAFQGSQTKRYKGGTAQNIWYFASGADEAKPLFADFTGTTYNPMWHSSGRVYYLCDQDGTMEVWSMKGDASDRRQETNHQGETERLLDVKSAAIDGDRIVYQLGADLWLYDLAKRASSRLEVRLDSDFDQTRENWVEKPMDYLTSVAVSPDGSRVVLTARGEVFVAPKEPGRLVQLPRKDAARYRNARFMPDGKTILLMSDESGEVEFWTAPSDGVGGLTQLTTDGRVLRWEGVPSPDGSKIAHHDKDQKLWVFDSESGASVCIETNGVDTFGSLGWSPDSRYLAYTAWASNFNRQAKVYDSKAATTHVLTTDRFDTAEVAFAPDGERVYLLSDRNIRTVVGSPWGALQPEPYFDKKTLVYTIPLKKGLRSPFRADDEVSAAAKEARKEEEKKKEEKEKNDKKDDGAGSDKPTSDEKLKDAGEKEAQPKDGTEAPHAAEIEFEGIIERIELVPVPAGNYSAVSVGAKRLFFMSSESGGSSSLAAVDIATKDVEVKTIVKDATAYELSRDGKSLMVRKGAGVFVIDAGAGANADLSKAGVDLSNWKFPLIPREEWRQMFVEAWRLERDYFYDTGMHGTDWPALLQRYLPLVDRVTTRGELNDLISQMVGELSALHIFVRGGDQRRPPLSIAPASLGAVLERDEAAGGFRVARIYRADPDYPDRRSPLAAPGVDVAEGDLIEQVNGRPALGSPDVGALLRNQSGRQVLLTVRPKGGGDARRVIVTPISMGSEEDLRYHEWQFTRREIVEKDGGGDLGYVHLRAMGGENMNEFARGFYPVFNRKGLIIDVRHNRGGNIDSWLLSRLLRKAWFFWQPRVGDPFWNMQLAFRGHVVVLCNERTASDGEAFTEGVKRLNIGHTIGTRTWGGEIWLSSSNFLVDGGIATAAEIGVYGPEGDWLIEGHGVEPDQVVDNLPHATFKGEDAQLRAAIEYLKKKIEAEPVAVPPIPAHPDKSWGENSRRR